MRRLRLTYANVMATGAMFVALGGSSYAVTQLPRNSVGDRQLKPSSVSGPKIRDQSVGRADLAADAILAGPRGPRGADGTAGPKGERGEPGAVGQQGSRGPSDIITATRSNVVYMPLAAGTVDVVTLTGVSAGSWWVMGSVSAVNDGGGDQFRCHLTFGGVAGKAGAVSRVGTDAPSAFAAPLIVHEGAVLAAETTIRLRCGHDGALGGGNPRLDHAQLTAVRTDALHIQAG